MSESLYNIGSPVDRGNRKVINLTYDDILARFNNIQKQINFLAGGQEIDEIIKRIEDTITKAQSDVAAAIEANNTATQDVITANNQALQTALDTIAGALTDLDNAINEADTATADTIAAKNAALQATADAQTAITQMQSLINNFKSRGPWSSITEYKINNLAEAKGKTYIALQDHTNKSVTDAAYWALFADQGVKGDKGDKGDTGAALSILGKLTDPSQLPPTGTAGDAYTVNGELYVWSENTNDWENVGNIKGEKGDKGEEGGSAYEVAVASGFVGTEAEWLASLKGQKGDKGEPGADADLSQIEQTVSALDTKFTTHLEDFELHTPYVEGISTDGIDYAVTLEGVTEYKVGMGMAFKFNINPTDFVYININGLGRFRLVQQNGMGVKDGMIQSDRIYDMRFTGVMFVLQGGNTLISSSLKSDSTTQAATSSAVKAVNDKLISSSVALGFSATTGNQSVAIGNYTVATGDFSVGLGLGAVALNRSEGHLGGASNATTTWLVPGSFRVTGTKNFEMPHPHPDKKATHVIRHGAVESPTAGDTLYRYNIEANQDSETVELQLPDYFRYLNKDVDVYVSPYLHFGRAFGIVEGDILKVTCEKAGRYKALVIGTRNDDHESVQTWDIKGVEREIGESWLGETHSYEVDEITEVTEFEEVYQ